MRRGLSPVSVSWRSGVWSLSRLAWTQHPGRLATGLLVMSLAACASEPSNQAGPTSPSTETFTSATPATASTPTTKPTAWTHEDLRVELIEMMRQDQLERTGEGLPDGTPLPPIQDYTRAIRLDEIVDEVGWPTFAMVGKEGSTAAWLIAQHADHDGELQARWLGLVDTAARTGQADPTEAAYLADRVAVNQNEPQLYGTQIRCRGGQPTPATPIEDDATVDERRRNVGLEPLTDYYDELSMMCAQEDAQGQSPAD